MNQRKFRYFAIFGTMRSGSNLLEQALNQFDGIRCYGELFNPSFIGGPRQQDSFGFSLAERERDPVALIEAMIDAAGDSIAGFRIFDGHDPRITEHALRDPLCAKILLRRDFLDSYVSLKIARKTDQWLLRNAPQRKKATIRFDAAEFAQYRRQKQAYFDRIRKALQESGQTAFELTYPAQKDVGVLNGIAQFLGASARIRTLKETIRPQNPEPLSEKVENFAEMQAALALQEGTGTVTRAADPLMRANIPRMVTCTAHPILFAPIPGGPNEEVLRWMARLDGAPEPESGYSAAVQTGTLLHTGHSQRTLFEWMHSNPDVQVISAVRHPLPRAYDAFMSKIFATGPGTYDMIRKQLVESFDVNLPDAADIDAGTYGIREHRNAFHAFLRFLKSNLAGQTSIRVDGLWASQMSFLAAFNTAVPVTLVAREGRLDGAFRYVESLLDIPPPQLGPPLRPEHRFPLDKIYTRQTENLARKAYNVDYTRLGFDDYQAALEA